MNVGDKVTRVNAQHYRAGEVIEITGDKALVLWSGTKVRTRLKLTSLQPYRVYTEQEKILAQIERNKRQINRRGNTPLYIRWLMEENKRLEKLI